MLISNYKSGQVPFLYFGIIQFNITYRWEKMGAAKYVFIQPLHLVQHPAQGHFKWSSLVFIQSLFIYRLAALPRLGNLVYPTIYQ